MSPSRTDDLRAYFSAPNATPRPILTSLNGDHSWLASFPRPAAERAQPNSKTFFHVVIDPWLAGESTLLGSWFISITTPAPAAINSGAAVEDVVREIEAAANQGTPRTEEGTDKTNNSSPIDAIFLNFHYGDHVHEPTLRTFNRDIPVFATAESGALAQKLNHFSHLTFTHDLVGGSSPTQSWRSLRPGQQDSDSSSDASSTTTAASALPDWLTVFRIPGHHELNHGTAIIYSPPSPDPATVPQRHETLLLIPHGIRTDQPALQAFLTFLRDEDPKERLDLLALLHPLKVNYAFGRQFTMGLEGGMELLEEFPKGDSNGSGSGNGPRYWIPTHNAMLGYAGLLAWVMWINDVVRTVGEAQEEMEKKQKGPKVVGVENGSCLVLV
ncbi:hypothetical protein B0J18DRAFT_236720 [Chaetomium sp. MPI-SDFR-AT-0129]|nr:hypothetical protein B0J18DRAFT_236720 [Chaetomium sp. MPI-SDFR-AT-0129]